MIVRSGGADASRRLDERQVLQRQRVAANQTGEGRDAEDRHRNDDVGHAAAEDRHDPDREKDAGEGEQHVADAHDDALRPSFVVSGDEAQHRADDGADGNRDEAGGQRNPRAHHDAAEDVASERIDAEPVLQRGQRIEAVVVEEILRVVRDDPRREDRDDDEQQHENAGRDRDVLLLELAPELGPRRANRRVLDDDCARRYVIDSGSTD